MLEHSLLTTVEAFILLLTVVHAFSQGGSSACSHAKLAYESKGINLLEIPASVVSDKRLNVCSGRMSCCTSVMETYLVNMTRWQFHGRVLNKMRELHLLFANVTSTFDDFFVNLLDTSLVEMHRMLIKSYGLLYEQNSQLFFDLFNDLRAYFKTGSVDLSDALDIFFETLFQRVFVLFNAQYVFDEGYEDCVAENTKSVTPFDDIPHQLSSKVKQSFTAARMFVRALSCGRDVMMDMMRKLEQLISTECSHDLMRLYGCQYCQLATSALPCHSACIGVVDRCFAGLDAFSQEWDHFIKEMVLLAERLEGPLNIEHVVEPIDMKLSEAISSFQENSVLISSKVFEICGQPSVENRRKRDAAGGSRSSRKAVSAPWPVSHRRAHIHDTSDIVPTVGVAEVVRSIRIGINATFGFWKQLSLDECSNFTSSAARAMCWNGSHLISHSSAVDADVHNILRNASSISHQQLFRLIAINNQIRRGRLRYDDWNEDDGDSGSGDGASGSGSGEDSGAATVSDLWQFVSFTTYAPPTVPVSSVANQGSTLFSIFVVVICIAVFPVVGPVLYC